MAPERFRNVLGFVGLAASLVTLVAATPALAQSATSGSIAGAVPAAVALGAAAFGLLATIAFRRLLLDGRAARDRAAGQAATLRARLDEYEALLSGARELIILWTDFGAPPRLLGQPSVLLPAGRSAESVLDYASWLVDGDAEALARAAENLRMSARGFELTLRTRDGKVIRAAGSLLGNGVALRLRPAVVQQSQPDPLPPPDRATARTVLTNLTEPAFLRDAKGRLTFVNPAYHDLARTMGRRSTDAEPAQLIDSTALQHDAGREIATVKLGERAAFELIEFPLEGGSAGYLRPRPATTPEADAHLAHLSAIIDALATPIAIFNAGRELVQFNRAYLALWNLDPAWLKPGTDERVILDRLRTEGKLPAEPDYQGWRARHLMSYELKGPKELDPWHLPDGRTIQVIAAPAGAKGGVIYVFEDITSQLILKSQHRAVLDVQRSSLNALSEAVAVFGTNGRLTLSNPRMLTLWKLSADLLSDNPHIDQISAAVADALPEDGAGIWRELKRSIIDLNPMRSDKQGRFTRADGKLIDYAITRLPDGQTMMTFLDVTESANYQRVLKERNEALITADRLKDAFVQNVSYELRSPLTNIIGFADLLASGTAGELNDKQRSYTDYIRSSSVTLGVLIDNILDLATVDAGIAELRPELQDVQALVEKATAGVLASFPEIDGEKQINLKVEIDPDLPAFVADGTRIVQVLYNLLANAARFSEPGGEIRLEVTGRSGRIQFVVEDEGAPMSEEMRAAMLDSENVASARQRGAGLGLAIVRAFVSLHGGTLSIEKRDPRGSRVIVGLPSDAAMAGAAE